MIQTKSLIFGWMVEIYHVLACFLKDPLKVSILFLSFLIPSKEII